MSATDFRLPITFDLPQRLRRLSDLAYNLWWTWNNDAEWIFRRIDPETWEAVAHNPVTFLRKTARTAFTAATRDLTYLNRYDEVVRAFDHYLQGGDQAWYPRQYADRMNSPIGYFSTEFGLHESLPIYAGGLGVLSGDHLKEASDLGMPMVAVGFLYTQGYFKQHITEDGWQESLYSSLDFEDLPVHRVIDQEGNPLTVGGRSPRTACAGAFVAHPSRPGPIVPARQQCRGQRADGPRPDVPPVHQRHGAASVAGDPARSGRRARPARPRLQPGRVAHERRAFRLSFPRTPAGTRGRRASVRDCPRTRAPKHDLHHPHARPRQPRRLPAVADRQVLRQLLAASWASIGRNSSTWRATRSHGGKPSTWPSSRSTCRNA